MLSAESHWSSSVIATALCVLPMSHGGIAQVHLKPTSQLPVLSVPSAQCCQLSALSSHCQSQFPVLSSQFSVLSSQSIVVSLLCAGRPEQCSCESTAATKSSAARCSIIQGGWMDKVIITADLANDAHYVPRTPLACVEMSHAVRIRPSPSFGPALLPLLSPGASI